MTGLDMIASKLRAAGLRPTRQRLALAQVLFQHGDRHICAEILHREARAAKVGVSLATVYNTLNQFTVAGLLREVAIEGDRSYFDTNTSNHFHFFDEDKSELFDIGADDLEILNLPEAPEGMAISRVDVIVRLKPRTA
jgi:Fur family iron response transcriptional regulator